MGWVCTEESTRNAPSRSRRSDLARLPISILTFWLVLDNALAPFWSAHIPQIGNEILFVNGFDVRTATHAQVLSIISQSKQALDLVVHPKRPRGLSMVDKLEGSTPIEDLRYVLGQRHQAAAALTSPEATVEHPLVSVEQDRVNQEAVSTPEAESALQKLATPPSSGIPSPLPVRTADVSANFVKAVVETSPPHRVSPSQPLPPTNGPSSPLRQQHTSSTSVEAIPDPPRRSSIVLGDFAVR